MKAGGGVDVVRAEEWGECFAISEANTQHTARAVLLLEFTSMSVLVCVSAFL